MVVVAVERHIYPADKIPQRVGKTDIRGLFKVFRGLKDLGLILGYCAVVPGAAVVKKDQIIPCPKFMPYRIIGALPEAGDHVPRCQINQPDTLVYQIPGAFMAEHGQGLVKRRKLEMPKLVGILINLAYIAAHNIEGHNLAPLDRVQPLGKTRVIGPSWNVGVFIDNKTYPPPALAERH